MTISIVLADDHHVIRQGLKALLDAEPDFNVIGETGDGLEVADLVEQLRPHVLVLDLMMPGLSGLEATRRISKRSPGTSVVILSMHSNEAYVLEALKAGANAYVLKKSQADELVQAIREVDAGRSFLSSTLSQRAIEVYKEIAEATETDRYDSLTAREREMLNLVAEGYTNTQIATRLSISSRTVEGHRANLMRKLNLKNHTELIRYALWRGILPIE